MSCVFVSYSHADRRIKEEVMRQLASLRHAGADMQVWADDHLQGGETWRREIDAAMRR